MQLQFSETMSGTEGFSFDYAVASVGGGVSNVPAPSRVPGLPGSDLSDRRSSRLVATAESEDSLIPLANRERRTPPQDIRPRTGAVQFNPDLAAT